jgi:hypothetical protein
VPVIIIGVIIVTIAIAVVVIVMALSLSPLPSSFRCWLVLWQHGWFGTDYFVVAISNNSGLGFSSAVRSPAIIRHFGHA